MSTARRHNRRAAGGTVERALNRPAFCAAPPPRSTPPGSAVGAPGPPLELPYPPPPPPPPAAPPPPPSLDSDVPHRGRRRRAWRLARTGGPAPPRRATARALLPRPARRHILSAPGSPAAVRPGVIGLRRRGGPPAASPHSRLMTTPALEAVIYLWFLLLSPILFSRV